MNPYFSGTKRGEKILVNLGLAVFSVRFLLDSREFLPMQLYDSIFNISWGPVICPAFC